MLPNAMVATASGCGEASLASEHPQHERSCHRALLDRSGVAEDFVPVCANRLEIERASDHGFERLVFSLLGIFSFCEDRGLVERSEIPVGA